MGKKLNNLTISDLKDFEIKYFKHKYNTEDLDVIIKHVNEDYYTDPCDTCPTIIKNNCTTCAIKV